MDKRCGWLWSAAGLDPALRHQGWEAAEEWGLRQAFLSIASAVLSRSHPHRPGCQCVTKSSTDLCWNLRSSYIHIWFQPPPQVPQNIVLCPPESKTWGTPDQAYCWAACSCAPPPCSTLAWAGSSALQKAIGTGGWSSTWAQPIRAYPWRNTSLKKHPSSSSEAFPGVAPRWCASCWMPTMLCGAGKRPEWFPASWPCGPPGAAQWRRGCDWTRPASLTRCWTQPCEHSC